MSAAVVAIPECLWTKVCPNCGYSLEGAPSIGTCPECGRAYDQSEVILHGHARGKHETLTNAKRSRMGWMMFGSIFWISLVVLGMLHSGGRFPTWILAFVGIMLLNSAYQVIRRQGSAHPGLVQIRLNSHGCVQYDDLAGPSVLRELSQANSFVIPVALAIGLATALWFKWISSVLFWIYLTVSLLFIPRRWESSRRFRRVMRQARNGSVADLNAALAEPTPWRQVTGVGLEKLPGDGCLFRVSARYGFFTPTIARTPVDAEVNCTIEQIAELWQLIGYWRDQSSLGA